MSKDESNSLDDSRAAAIDYARNPENIRQLHTFANLNRGHPFAVSVARYMAALREQYCSAKYYEPRKEEKDSKYYADVDFDPRIHYKLDDKAIAKLAEEFVNNLLASTTSVGAKRAESILETVRDIGRPQMDMGAFGTAGMEELEPPEEVEKRE